MGLLAKWKAKGHIRHIKNNIINLRDWILKNVTNNPERSLGLIKLKECEMWLKEAILRQGESK